MYTIAAAGCIKFPLARSPFIASKSVSQEPFSCVHTYTPPKHTHTPLGGDSPVSGLAGSYETQPYLLAYACETSATCSDFVFLLANWLETFAYSNTVFFF